MITYSIIQKSQLEGALRLDAEYYQPEYLEATKKLKKYEPLKKFVGNIIHPQEVKREYSESGYLFLLSQNLRENYLDFSDKFYINEETAKQISKNLLEENDIVTIRTGNIGLSAVISGFKEKICASADVIVIKNPKISPFYISTFLNSKFGKMYLNRIIYGALQPHITPKLLGEIPLPLPDESNLKEIHSLVETALNNFEQSEDFYSQAENLLLEELGLKDFKVEDDLFYVVNLSEIKSAHRADAEYFQPKYEKIISKIKKQNAKLIGEISQFVGHATQPPYDEMGDIAVLAQKHMKRNLAIDTSAFDNYTTENLIKKSDKKFILRKGDLLISSAGEPGLTCVWTEEGKVIPGSFITIVRFTNKVEPFYVGVFLNTIGGRLQFERDYSGSVQQYVYPVKIKEILIPILPKPTQQKIADLVQKSHEARKKAAQLLEEAKRKVEELIKK